METRLRALIFRQAEQLHCEMVALEGMPDHLHWFLKAPPNHAPQHIANQRKGFPSHQWRSEFPDLNSRRPSLGSRSDSVGSAGAVSAATLHNYSEPQKAS
jgi:putative transposase